MRGSVFQPQHGFSLLETLAATALTAGIAAVAFQLFHQSERVFRDQALILEMQQGARVVVAQVVEDIRRAGQSVPPGLEEIILPGSGVSRLNLRASYSAVESHVVSSLPLSFVIGTPATVLVDSTSGISSGRQAFLWGGLAWARVTVDSVSGSAQSVRLTPTAATSMPLDFLAAPTLSLDEAVSIFWDETAKSVRRTTASNTLNPASPAWAPANELVTNVTALNLVYLDASGNAIVPDTEQNRSQVREVQIRIALRCSAPLSDGSRPVYALSSRAVPRNIALR